MWARGLVTRPAAPGSYGMGRQTNEGGTQLAWSFTRRKPRGGRYRELIHVCDMTQLFTFLTPLSSPERVSSKEAKIQMQVRQV